MSFKKLTNVWNVQEQLLLSNATYNKNLELEKRLAKIRNEIPQPNQSNKSKVTKDVSTQTKTVKKFTKKGFKKVLI